MPLLDLWQSNSSAVVKLRINQVVSTAGDGKLRDGSVAAQEIRAFLAQVPSEKLEAYAAQCLDSPFPQSGLVLQDVVNELGRRLEYTVQNGRYQGVQNSVGYAGIWVAPEGIGILVEVKTTDAYRIPLDRIAEYRRSSKTKAS
jgi:hypothetical protein